MNLTLESKKPVARLREDVAKASAPHGFGVLGVIDLREKMREKGVAYAQACVVVEVCSPSLAQRVLEVEPGLATLLPCRIAAYETPDGRTWLATAPPTALVRALGVPAAAPLAAEIEATLAKILAAAV